MSALRASSVVRPASRLVSCSRTARASLSTARLFRSELTKSRPSIATSLASKCRIPSIQAPRFYSTSPVPTEADVDQVSIDEYHSIADNTMEGMINAFEELGETMPDLDVELSQGVLTLYLPPNGSYVINKQPPNRQIWWSSPLSGPKRFDLVGGVWTSLRDGSTLLESLEEETKIVTDSRNLSAVTFEL